MAATAIFCLSGSRRCHTIGIGKSKMIISVKAFRVPPTTARASTLIHLPHVMVTSKTFRRGEQAKMTEKMMAIL